MLILGLWALTPRLYGFATIPLRVRFIGALVSSKDENRNGALENLQVLVGKEKRIFLVDKVEIVGSGGINRTVLQRLFPPSVRFFGADDVILRLRRATILGRLVTIDGYLYPDTRMLFVTAVDEAEAADTS